MLSQKENLNVILQDTKNQIASFDQKAGTMLTIIGIMFALITYFCGIFGSDTFNKSSEMIRVVYMTFFILFCLSAIFALTCFVLVIVPKKKPKIKNNDINQEKHINYYFDAAQLDDKEFYDLLQNYTLTDDVLVRQIINNAIICKKKHKLLFAGICSLIPFILLTFVMLMSIVFVF